MVVHAWGRVWLVLLVQRMHRASLEGLALCACNFDWLQLLRAQGPNQRAAHTAFVSMQTGSRAHTSKGTEDMFSVGAARRGGCY